MLVFSLGVGWAAGVRFLVEARDFSPLHSAETGSGDHPTFWSIGMDVFAGGGGVKPPGREADHTPPASAEVKHGGAIPPLPHTSVWLDAYLFKYKGNYIFALVMLYRD
jgi:hypothetical protein